jgi:hypothetical protein
LTLLAAFQFAQRRWVEVCYCPAPLLEERPHWEKYSDLVKVQDAHDRCRCRDQNGSGRDVALFSIGFFGSCFSRDGVFMAPESGDVYTMEGASQRRAVE